MKETAVGRKRGEESRSACTATGNGDAAVSAKGEEEKSERHRSLFKKAARASLFTARLFTVRALSLQWNGVPIRRRIQTGCVLLWLLGFAVFPLLMWPLVLFVVFCTPLSPFVIGYLTWVFFYDDSAQTGKRRRPISKFRIWKQIRDYFPIRMIKTADIEPDRSYVFGYHPHGVISMGALVNFATYATGLDKTYPGVNVHVLTLAGNFYLPVLREWVLWMGICDASRETCHNILTKGGGESILLAVGGAEESLDAFPGKYKLTLKNRKGFVRVALKAGASLVCTSI
jgi:2-acylglycerol O-acyltransferase 2